VIGDLLRNNLFTLCLGIFEQVPSGLSARIVGYEDPNTHAIVWFELNKGPLHYVPDIGLYFKLKANH
jgi:hypothetical protein